MARAAVALRDLPTRSVLAVLNATRIGLELPGGWTRPGSPGSKEQLLAKQQEAIAELARRGIVMDDDELDIETADGPPDPALGADMESCRAPSCPEFARAHGLCPGHYLKWRKGDPALAAIMEEAATGEKPATTAVRGLAVSKGSSNNDATGAAPNGLTPKPLTPTPLTPIPTQENTMATKTANGCAVPGCTRPAKTRGICGAHYIMQLKPGHPQAAAIRSAMLPSKTTGRGRQVGGRTKDASGGGAANAGAPSAPRPGGVAIFSIEDLAAIAGRVERVLAALGIRCGILPHQGGYLLVCGDDAALLRCDDTVRKVRLSVTADND